MTNCPCCGAPLDGPSPVTVLEFMNLTGHERAIVGILVRRHPRGVPMVDVIDAMYSNHYNGGPDNPERTVTVIISKLRRKLVGSGWSIPTGGGRGCKALYRLERET